MKRFLLLNVIGFLLVSGSFGQTLQRTILSHDGVLTQYDAAHWQDAITNAVDGDIVYFTPGTFSGDITINKAISLIGAGVSVTDCFYPSAYGDYCTTGESTTISGNIDIAIPGSRTLTAPVLEGIRQIGYQTKVIISQPVKNLTIKRCQLSPESNVVSFKATASVENLTLESCYIQMLNCDNFVNPDIHNCYIVDFEYDPHVPEGTEFINCAIVYPRYFSNCRMTNCIISEGMYDGPFTFKNCLCVMSSGSSTYTDCWNSFSLFSSNNPCELSKAAILAKEEATPGLSIRGTDGTVVGPFGGPAPFTFKPSQPYVAFSALNYNATTKKLNVTMTINKGE